MDRRYSPMDDLRDLRAVFAADADLTTPQRVVLAALLLHRNGKTGRMDPSAPTIASETGQGRSTVLRVLGQLEGEWISFERRRGTSTQYTFVTRPEAGLVPVPEWDRAHPGAGPERAGKRTNRTSEGLSGPCGPDTHLSLDQWRTAVHNSDRESLASSGFLGLTDREVRWVLAGLGHPGADDFASPTYADADELVAVTLHDMAKKLPRFTRRSFVAFLESTHRVRCHEDDAYSTEEDVLECWPIGGGR